MLLASSPCASAPCAFAPAGYTVEEGDGREWQVVMSDPDRQEARIALQGMDDMTVEEAGSTSRDAAVRPRLSGELPAELPRRRGPGGDVGYVLTAAVGAWRTRGRLQRLLREQQARGSQREMLVLALGREVGADASIDLPAAREARTQLAELAATRTRSAGEAAAAAAEVVALREDRTAASISASTEIERLRGESRRADDERAPLERKQGEYQSKIESLRDTLRGLDKKIRTLEARLRQGSASDAASMEAELASMRAERESVAREEPAAAAAIEELAPQIAALQERRHALEQQIAATRAADREAQAESALRITAEQARQAEAEQDTAAAGEERRAVLLALGERLYRDRPVELEARLRVLLQHERTTGVLERRTAACEQLMGNIDRLALVRGVLMLLALAGAVAAAAWLVLAG